MTDHYQTLGVSEAATPDEIKKAYRSLANKHHPDKGGDQAMFKDISVAYDTLSDANKKAEYDQQRMYGGGPQVRFTSDDFGPFGGMFSGGFPGAHPFGDIFGRQMRRNRDLNIHCQITLLDSFTGKQLEANYQMPSGKSQTVVINVPAGINHGETIRYQGLGDDSIAGLARGHLNVTVIVQPDAKFERRGDDLYTSIDITPIESMIGCKKSVDTIDGQKLELDIRAGIEAGTEYASHGNGFPNPNHGQRGRFVTVVKVKSKPVTDATLIQTLKDLDAQINK